MRLASSACGLGVGAGDKHGEDDDDDDENEVRRRKMFLLDKNFWVVLMRCGCLVSSAFLLTCRICDFCETRPGNRMHVQYLALQTLKKIAAKWPWGLDEMPHKASHRERADDHAVPA